MRSAAARSPPWRAFRPGSSTRRAAAGWVRSALRGRRITAGRWGARIRCSDTTARPPQARAAPREGLGTFRQQPLRQESSVLMLMPRERMQHPGLRRRLRGRCTPAAAAAHTLSTRQREPSSNGSSEKLRMATQPKTKKPKFGKFKRRALAGPGQAQAPSAGTGAAGPNLHDLNEGYDFAMVGARPRCIWGEWGRLIARAGAGRRWIVDDGRRRPTPVSPAAERDFAAQQPQWRCGSQGHRAKEDASVHVMRGGDRGLTPPPDIDLQNSVSDRASFVSATGPLSSAFSAPRLTRAPIAAKGDAGGCSAEPGAGREAVKAGTGGGGESQAA